MSATETFKLAHTVRCKLQIAADRPDRNLRFILGHAFTLDKLRLRIAEVAIKIEEDNDAFDEPSSNERRVSFQSHHPPGPPKGMSANRRRSPPPDQLSHLDDTESDEEEYDDEEEEDLALQRFPSAAAQPPRMIDDDGGSSEDEDEPKSPPPLSNEELETLTGGPGDAELSRSYRDIRGCPCHGNKDHVPSASQVWKIPRKDGYNGPRLAVVQVEA